MEQLNVSNLLGGLGGVLLIAGAIQLLHEAAVLRHDDKGRIGMTLNLKNWSIRSVYPGVIMITLGFLLLEQYSR